MEKNAPPQRTLPRIYLISSGKEHPENCTLLTEQLTLLPHSFPCMVQIREKQLNTRQLLTLALKARQVTLPKETLLLINERLDIALAASLDGIHLPENACSADILRPHAPKLLFGCSVHSEKSVRLAEESGAEYLLFSPIFDTPSKRQYGAPQGLKTLGKLCKTTPLPIFALGGITLHSAAHCMAEGAYGIAGISMFQDLARFVETLEQFHMITTS